MKKKRIMLFLAGLCLAAFLIKGLDNNLVVRRYTIESTKLTQAVRLVFLSDLHSCEYGNGQGELLDLTEAQQPDLVLLGGDWVDDNFGRLPPERAYGTARALAERYPTFYATGNHELWSGYVEEIKGYMAAQGVTVLSGESDRLVINGQAIQICGLDDPDVGETVWAEELMRLRAGRDDKAYTLLLSHRPERSDDYGGFDLVLAGHAHGGQWRLPPFLDGVFAPNQGFFPKWTGGTYGLEGGGTLVVSRGLSRESTRIPRFWNPTEIVVVELVPAV